MKIAATGLLVVMTGAFVATSLPPAAKWPAVAYVHALSLKPHDGGRLRRLVRGYRAFSPAFWPRRIPHTAIIPRNKDRIRSGAPGRFVVENFLSGRVHRRPGCGSYSSARGEAPGFKTPANARSVAERVLVWGPRLMQVLPAGTLEELAGAAALAAVKGVPAAPTAASALLSAVCRARGQRSRIIERVAALLSDYLEQRHQGVILLSHGLGPVGTVDARLGRSHHHPKNHIWTCSASGGPQRFDHPWRGGAWRNRGPRLIVRLATDP